MALTTTATARPALVRRAILLEAAIIAYNIVEGIVSVAAGLVAGSIALIGFGFDSALEVSATSVVLVHLWKNSQEEGSPWERRVAVFVGLLLLVLAAYVTAGAIYDLATGSRPDESYIGIAIAAASAVVMPLVSRWQKSLALQINSLALAADARDTMACAALSVALLVGLGANALFGWWWADPVAALVIVVFIAREGWEIFSTRELVCFDD